MTYGPFLTFPAEAAQHIEPRAAPQRGSHHRVRERRRPRSLKVRDFLASLRRTDEQFCKQDLHLLCRSMGNYLLQNTLERCDAFTPGNALPRLFEHIFMCAPDADDTALEKGQPLWRAHELARSVSAYHNRGDAALVVSDYTKGNPDRLGSNGPARPTHIHNKVHQIATAICSTLPTV